MAAANHCVRPRLSPCPLVPVSLSLPAPPASRRLRRGRPPFASWRPPPSPSPAPPLPRKRVSGTHREDAEADGAVVDEGAEAKEQLERGDGEYASSVGTNFSLPLPARLRVARAAPGGDPVFFLLAAVAVTVRRRANLWNKSVVLDLISRVWFMRNNAELMDCSWFVRCRRAWRSREWWSWRFRPCWL
ncbi:hypothetical protein SEVIR_3G321000v4 [Setaria viridis]